MGVLYLDARRTCEVVTEKFECGLGTQEQILAQVGVGSKLTEVAKENDKANDIPCCHF